MPEETPLEVARRVRRESGALRRRAVVLRAASEQTRCEVEMARTAGHLARRRARRRDEQCGSPRGPWDPSRKN